VPIDIDPEWEYWVGDPEITELLQSYAGSANRIDLLADDRLADRGANLGIRFGKGNPDHCRFTLARPRPERYRDDWEPISPRACSGCGFTFQPDRRGRRYCSSACAKPECCFYGSERCLPDITCPICNVPFRPRTQESKFCSLACTSLSQKKEAILASDKCPACGKDIDPSASPNQRQEKKYCSPRCKRAFINRKWRERQRSTLTPP
jgi:hypothetical protein